ncbi:MAG: 1-acyl-sn-glycerol-3-phosphate acyltransferase [Paludibacteraceae bacterium]|nr:1-acyl-sn-glycerol-3-phosphate acyltransferase [Paludibacteraceae bacterium]
MFKEKFCKAVLKLFGWTIAKEVDLPEKCVFCVAPHTSNWDFFVGYFAYPAIGGTKKQFMIKKDWFIFPFNLFFKAAGGIPVDRSKRVSTVDQLVEACNNSDHFHLAITPEGTRSANANWKRGFYYIAQNANIAISLVYFDYGKKEVGLKKLFYPTGDADADMAEIKEYYKGVTAKYPEKFAV